jgi:hypothetical protein
MRTKKRRKKKEEEEEEEEERKKERRETTDAYQIVPLGRPILSQFSAFIFTLGFCFGLAKL